MCRIPGDNEVDHYKEKGTASSFFLCIPPIILHWED